MMTYATHEALLDEFGSAYELAQRSGIPYQTAKRYWRHGKIADPKLWPPIMLAASVDATLFALDLANDLWRVDGVDIRARDDYNPLDRMFVARDRHHLAIADGERGDDDDEGCPFHDDGYIPGVDDAS